MNIRAFYRATKVENTQPPYDTIHLKVFYPAKMSGSDQEQNQGIGYCACRSPTSSFSNSDFIQWH